MSSQRNLHLIGIGVGHSIAPVMHNHICKRLQQPYVFHATEAQTLDDVNKLLKSPDFGGAVITMPYKQSVVDLLDETDELVATIGACNNVYPRKSNQLRTELIQRPHKIFAKTG
ncbi:hypothetical protein KC323_g6475, partial [Hortaea werneckii]